ncbi:hypothetical protein HZC32_00115 [Candidatus Woesearchaeota archaeon]|nr:hypothetical protein [Candidatus Woesearchaeota archaeon]
MREWMVVILFLGIVFILGCSPSPVQLEKFAVCLKEKGAVMYGAYWCPHCQEQKQMFGESFSKLDYVECEIDTQRCAVEEIAYLPTWKFKDNTSVSKVMPLEELAEKTGCGLG